MRLNTHCIKAILAMLAAFFIGLVLVLFVVMCLGEASAVNSLQEAEKFHQAYKKEGARENYSLAQRAMEESLECFKVTGTVASTEQIIFCSSGYDKR